MNQIINIPLNEIDPNSTINVRRTNVAEAVERVKASIQKNGFWESSPITVRPHPDQSSEFKYEIVAGQCRFKSSLELELLDIPATVNELSNNEAIKQSWSENEFSTELSPTDKAYWIHKIMQDFTEKGYGVAEARTRTADFFNISIPTVINYIPLVGLPEKSKKLLEEGKLPLASAKVIAKKTYDPKHPADSEKLINERVDWVIPQDREGKIAATKAMSKLGSAATIEQLEAEKEKILDKEWAKVEVAVPQALHDKLINWGEERGLEGVSEAKLIQHMIVETLKKY